MKENEINILMNLIKKKGIDPNDGSVTEHIIEGSNNYNPNGQGGYNDENKMPDLNVSIIEKVDNQPKKPVYSSKWEKMNIPDEILGNREKAFEMFKTNYQSTQAFEDNKDLLKEKIKSAKTLGQEVGIHRNKINEHKNEIEQIRKEMAVQGLINMDDEVPENPREIELRAKIELEKKN